MVNCVYCNIVKLKVKNKWCTSFRLQAGLQQPLDGCFSVALPLANYVLLMIKQQQKRFSFLKVFCIVDSIMFAELLVENKTVIRSIFTHSMLSEASYSYNVKWKKISYLNYSSSLTKESKLVNDFTNFLPHIYMKMQAWIGL